MNENLYPWRNWSNKEKFSLYSGFFILLSLLIFSIFSWYKGLANVMTWDIITQMKEKVIQAPPLYFDKYSFSANTPLWYVVETFAPSFIKVNVWAYYGLLGSFVLGVSYILSGLSRLRGVWFLVGGLLLCLMIVSLRIESVYLQHNNWGFLLLFACTGAIYYLTHTFAYKLTIFYTSLIWILFWFVSGLILTFTSAINEPFISMAAFGLMGALFVSAVFIFFISHEILAALMLVVSQNAERGKSALKEYLIVSGVFFVNAILVYLENAKRINESAFILSPLTLFIVSLLLGFLGFRKLIQERDWFSFQGVGAWIYLGMAIVSSGVVGFAYATANTSLIELVEDYISIAILAQGLCFFVHVLINFKDLILQGLPFYKVLYKPAKTRWLLARISAVFVMIFLFSLKNKHSFYQLKSGLNNAIADFYLSEGDVKAAEVYYKAAVQYDVFNEKSNLALGSLALALGDQAASIYYFEKAEKNTSSLFPYVGKSIAYEREGMFFDAIFSLNEGINKYPFQSELYTNLAQLQARAGVNDSVLVNINLALEHCKKCETETTNFLAFWIDNGKIEKLSEMRSLAKTGKSYSYKANNAALERILGENTSSIAFDVKQDSSLDVSRAAYLFNIASNPLTDSTLKVNVSDLRNFQNKKINEGWYEALSWVIANQNYYREDKISGIKDLESLAQSPSNLAPLYTQNLGIWFMREGLLSKAIENLKRAGDGSSAEVLAASDLNLAIDEQLEQQAVTLSENLRLNNYQEIMNKAPLNPYLRVRVAEFLSKNNQKLEAYNTLFYSMEYLGNSVALLKAYLNSALDLSMYEYAEDALLKLKPLISDMEFNKLDNAIQNSKQKRQVFN